MKHINIPTPPCFFLFFFYFPLLLTNLSFLVSRLVLQSLIKNTKQNAIGESGSGKTESTNFLLHHLTALSQKGSQGCGVEQTILSAGPVLEVSFSSSLFFSIL